MTVSTCAKCNGHSFELALLTPLGEVRKLTIVQCSTCGTPVAALDPALGPQQETASVTSVNGPHKPVTMLGGRGWPSLPMV